MTIRGEIRKLEELGRLPDESDDNLSSETIDMYANLLKSIEKPLNCEEAKIIIGLMPESGLYGLEWILLHLFESVYPELEEEKYIQLIAKCPSEEWRDSLIQRLENKKQNNDN